MFLFNYKVKYQFVSVNILIRNGFSLDCFVLLKIKVFFFIGKKLISLFCLLILEQLSWFTSVRTYVWKFCRHSCTYRSINAVKNKFVCVYNWWTFKQLKVFRNLTQLEIHLTEIIIDFYIVMRITIIEWQLEKMLKRIRPRGKSRLLVNDEK